LRAARAESDAMLMKHARRSEAQQVAERVRGVAREGRACAQRDARQQQTGPSAKAPAFAAVRRLYERLRIACEHARAAVRLARAGAARVRLTASSPRPPSIRRARRSAAAPPRKRRRRLLRRRPVRSLSRAHSAAHNKR
jgi:hypothetical protein